MKKTTFVVHLIILQKVLTTINILSNQLQSKSAATLENSVNIIKSVIKSFEDLRTAKGFSCVWTEIQIFLKKHQLTIDIPLQSQSNI